MKKSLLIIALFLTVLIMTGCKSSSDTEGNESIFTIYSLAVSAEVTELSYDEWIESIQGPQGESGKEVLLQVSEGYIQWHYIGDDTWINLVELVSLTGPSGSDGIDGTNGNDGTHGLDGTNGTAGLDGSNGTAGLDGSNGTDGLDGTNGTAGLDGTNGTDGLDGTNGTSGLDGTNGTAGLDGTNGEEVLFQISEGYIQWKYIGDAEWINLIGLSVLTGADGTNGTNGSNGTNGINGEEVILQVAEEFIQWQYAGDSAWTNLIEIATLIGNNGRGISSTEISQTGELIINFDDETSRNLGVIYTMYVVKLYIVLEMEIAPVIFDVFLVPYLSDIELPLPAAIDGYTFGDIIGDHEDVTENRDIFYVYGMNWYTITYLPGEGVETYPPVSVPYNDTLTLPLPTREGYSFAGWFEGDSINDSQSTNSTNVDESQNLVARWQVNQTITFYTGYNYIFVDQITGIYGSAVETPDNPIEPENGEMFGGWYADSGCIIPYVFDTMPAEDIIVYIKWINMMDMME